MFEIVLEVCRAFVNEYVIVSFSSEYIIISIIYHTPKLVSF